MGAEVISITVLLFFSVFWEKIELCIFDKKKGHDDHVIVRFNFTAEETETLKY